MAEITGTTIGHFRIENLIGAGGMGTVYKAYDLNLGRHVALKLIHSEMASQPEFRERLKAEAQAAANLDHPSIVKIYSFGESAENLLYVAMEYVKDGSLRSHIQRVRIKRANLETKLVLQIAIEIADALDVAHRNGVIHRDVKPGNIILKRQERADEVGFAPFRAVLTDFGLVHLTDPQRRGDPITRTGMAMGTPIYMSPEQCEGKQLDGRSDLYSLGVVLYEMLVGRPPFDFITLSEAVSAHVRNQYPVPVQQLRPELPALLDVLLSKVLAKQPEQRFATGKELSDALRTAYFALSDTPTSWWESQPEPESQEHVLAPPIAGDELIVRTMGRGAIDRYKLTKERYAIGRAADNDMVLASGAVSRHHARLEHTVGGWMVRPLVGINGTFLMGKRLTPDKQVLIKPGAPLLIGPYEMWISQGGSLVAEPTMAAEPTYYLEAASLANESSNEDISESTTTEAPAEAPTRAMRRVDLVEQSAAAAGSTPISDDGEFFDIFIDPRMSDVEPGRSAEFVLEILNRSAVDDRVRLEANGIPQTWVDLPRGFTPIPAGERAEVRFKVTPPRETSTSYGRQKFSIQLESQRQRGSRPSVGSELNISPFEAFDVVMLPHEVRLPAAVMVSISNQGNQPTDYAVVARESEDNIRFIGERGRVPVQPGQTVDVEVMLESKSSGWLSAENDIPYEVEVRSANGGVQVEHGVALVGSTLLPLLRLIGLMLLVMLCMLSLLFGASALFGSRTGARSTPPPIVAGANSLNATPTRLPAVGLTPTSTVLPTISGAVVDPADPDADGLTNAQENELGSAIDNPDTDGDGLTDGSEVFEHGTQPTNADSDGDGLSDGDEILRFFTLPRLRDSDNDGVDDGTEVAQGSDPRTPEVLPATALPTLPPTELPSLTPQPSETAVVQPSATPELTIEPIVVLTATPLPTNTPEPTLAPTNTLEPTPSSTATQVPTETPTPIATPTLAATATPTIALTIEPLPTEPSLVTGDLLSCVQLAPVIDGILPVDEWDADNLFATITASGGQQMQVHAAKDDIALYIAIAVDDPVAQAADALRIYVDVNNNGGDPDFEDRYFVIGNADDDAKVWSGIGTNVDGLSWNVGDGGDSDAWLVEVTRDASGWRIEMALEVAKEMPSLGAQFSLMTALDLSGADLLAWPLSAESINATTWQPINNSTLCQ